MCVFSARHTRYIDATAVDYYRAFYGKQTTPNYRGGGGTDTRDEEELCATICIKSHVNIVVDEIVDVG